MRCPLVYKSDLVHYVWSLNTSVAKSKISKMKKSQLYAIWYKNNRKW